MFQILTRTSLAVATSFALMTIAFMALFSVGASVQAQDCTGANDTPQCFACEGAGGNYITAGEVDPDLGRELGDCVGDDTDPALTGDDSIFETVVNVLTFAVGAISVIMLIVGGLRYVLSAGDSNAISGAKNTILYAIVGIVIAFAARAIVLFVIDRL